MKKVILGLKENRQVYLFIPLGILLTLFPHRFASIAPYVTGVALLAYAAVNLFVSVRYPDSGMDFGKSLVGVTLGTAILLQRSDSIATIGVIWAVRSLYEAAEELDELRETKKAPVVSLIGLSVSSVFALLLILNPFEHFATHIRILGLEILSSAFIRRRRGTAE